MFVVVQTVELRSRPGSDPIVETLGTFPTAAAALDAGRAAWRAFRTAGSDDYAHWVVKREGAQMAEWIADSRSAREFVVDLRSGGLVEIQV